MINTYLIFWEGKSKIVKYDGSKDKLLSLGFRKKMEINSFSSFITGFNSHFAPSPSIHFLAPKEINLFLLFPLYPQIIILFFPKNFFIFLSPSFNVEYLCC